MPDKRQESKQRRAARNRANREALAARRENAEVNAARAGKSSGEPKATTSGSGRGRAGRAASGTSARASAASPVAPTAASTPGKRPGEIFLWIAFGLAILGTLAMLFLLKAPVDDRGEPIPGGPKAFGGLTEAARETVTGEPLPDESVSYVEAYGASAVISAALPLSLTAFALWASRRRADRSRMLTYAMLGMAVAIFLGGGLFVFFPALIFLVIGGFVARRADLPARVAERATGTGGGLFGRRGAVVDAESHEVVEDDDAPAAARPDEDEGIEADEVEDAAADADPVDAGGAAETGGDDEPDPLAELEAELEAERAAEAAARGEQADEADDGGTRRKK